MTKTLPPQPPRWAFTRDFTSDDRALAEAWSQVAPSVESFYCGRFENGGAYLSVAMKAAGSADAEAAAVSDWMVWPEAGEILVKAMGAQSQRSRCTTLRAALQVTCPLSSMQWRGVELLGEAMLAYRRALEAEQADQDLSLAA